MIFRFRRAEVAPTPAYASQTIYRPKIPIWIGPRGGRRRPFLGLLDTGADDVKLLLPAAIELGIKLDRAHPITWYGVGGLAVGFYGEVVPELRQSPKSYIWAAQVAFVSDPANAPSEERNVTTLGHTGFFRYFHANFNFQRGRVSIRPNGLFVGLPSGT
jgi:hypothetical protein